MDPTILELIKYLGPPGVFAVLTWVLLREQMKNAREDAKDLLRRSDANQQAFTLAVNSLSEALRKAECRFTGPCQYQVPPSPVPLPTLTYQNPPKGP